MGDVAQVVAASGWTGPIPPTGYSVECVVRAYDAAGELVASEPLIPAFEALPKREEERVGGLISVTVPEETDDASISCATEQSED